MTYTPQVNGYEAKQIPYDSDNTIWQNRGGAAKSVGKTLELTVKSRERAEAFRAKVDREMGHKGNIIDTGSVSALVQKVDEIKPSVVLK